MNHEKDTHIAKCRIMIKRQMITPGTLLCADDFNGVGGEKELSRLEASGSIVERKVGITTINIVAPPAVPFEPEGKELSLGSRTVQMPSPEEVKKLTPTSKFASDPANLAELDLDALNVMVSERDATIPAFETPEEAIACLSEHFDASES